MRAQGPAKTVVLSQAGSMGIGLGCMAALRVSSSGLRVWRLWLWSFGPRSWFRTHCFGVLFQCIGPRLWDLEGLG